MDNRRNIGGYSTTVECRAWDSDTPYDNNTHPEGRGTFVLTLRGSDAVVVLTPTSMDLCFISKNCIVRCTATKQLGPSIVIEEQSTRTYEDIKVLCNKVDHDMKELQRVLNWYSHINQWYTYTATP